MYNYNLQVEPETTVPLQSKGGPKVNIRVERAKDREYRNRSEESQAAALAAPARVKRETTLTPKMAALKAAEASKIAKAAATKANKLAKAEALLLRRVLITRP